MVNKSKETRIKLRELMIECFDLGDIRTICYDLSIDYESLGGENLTKPERIIALLNFVKGRGRQAELIKILEEQRPHIAWKNYFREESFSSPIYYNLPPLPPHFLARDQQLQSLKSDILNETKSRPVAIVGQPTIFGVHGMGGLGKTVLATTIVYDDEIRQMFSDGIIWLSFGQEPNILALQVQLGLALGLNFEGDEFERENDIERAILRIRTKLQLAIANRKFLVVLDDVWQLEDVLHFQYPYSASQILFTTRNKEIITGSGAVEYSLDEFSETEALDFLGNWTGIPSDNLPETSKEVAHECGYLPLALSICGALIRDGIRWEDVLDSLRETDISFLEYQDKSVARSIQTSLDTLPDDMVKAFFTFSIFPEDTPVSEKALLIFWEYIFRIPPRESRKILHKFVTRSLVKLRDDGSNREYYLHDMIRIFVKNVVGDTKQLHIDFIQAFHAKYPKGKSLPDDEYFLAHMAYHTFEGGTKYTNSILSIMFSYFVVLSSLFIMIPLLLIIGVFVKLDSPGPIIYRRRVLGIKGNQFDTYKFRTMHANGDEILSRFPELQKELATNHKLKFDPRITKIGAFLRKASLDELPQLLNVLKLEMALVGPRMITPTEIENYGKFKDTLLMVMPGMTSAWQLSNNSHLTDEDRIQWDLTYIYNRSFRNDIKILFGTIPAVIKGNGVY